jgi:hypothetical protein
MQYPAARPVMPTAMPHARCMKDLFIAVNTIIEYLMLSYYVREKVIFLLRRGRQILSDEDGYDKRVHGDDTRHDHGDQTLKHH